MVVGIYFVISSFIRGKKPLNKLYWKYALTYSLPLIFHGLSLVLLSSSDRIMITNLYNSSEAGVYSLIYNLSMVAMAVTASLEAVWVPWFTRKLLTGEKSTINKNITKYLEIALVVMLCLMFVAPEIVKIMATKQYYSGIYMIPPLVFASYEMYMYTVYVNVEYYYKSTKYIAFNTIVAAITNIVLNFIFVPLYGGMAACFTTVISYMVSFLMHSKHSRKLDRELFPLKQFAVPTLILLLQSLLPIFDGVLDSTMDNCNCWIYLLCGICTFNKEVFKLSKIIDHKRINSFSTLTTNGFIESCNNKIKVNDNPAE